MILKATGCGPKFIGSMIQCEGDTGPIICGIQQRTQQQRGPTNTLPGDLFGWSLKSNPTKLPFPEVCQNTKCGLINVSIEQLQSQFLNKTVILNNLS